MKHHQRKCRCCKKWFITDPRNHHHQRFCLKIKCRKASKAASQNAGNPNQQTVTTGAARTKWSPCTPNDNTFIESAFSTVKRAPAHRGYFRDDDQAKEYFSRYFKAG